jgi:glycosyltransferase involved in cell wall biosynthesis
MRIGVNTRLLLKGKLEGIGHFTHELLKRIVTQHPEHEFFFFFDRPYDLSFVYAKNVTPIILKPQARHPFLFTLFTEIAIPQALKKYKIDVYFSPDGLGTLKTKVPTIVAFHDLAFLHFPQYISKLQKWHYNKFFPKFALNATKLIAVSEYTKQDIVKSYGIDTQKIHVIYNGVKDIYKPISYEEKLAVKQKYTDGNEYFLFVSAIHPRKNVINLLKAFVKFKRFQKSKMKLVMVGRMAWKSEEIQEAKDLMPYKDDVVWTGYMETEELAKVMASAYALVYPSFFEGFGIPIADALACNVPVITSNTSSMPEVGGEAALYVDPNSVEDITAKMNFIYKDETLRNKLIKACPYQVSKFNWDVSAQKLWEVLSTAKA